MIVRKALFILKKLVWLLPSHHPFVEKKMLSEQTEDAGLYVMMAMMKVMDKVISFFVCFKEA